MEAPSSMCIKSVDEVVKRKEEFNKPYSKINHDAEHFKTKFSGPVLYDEDLSHINPRDKIHFYCNKQCSANGISLEPMSIDEYSAQKAVSALSNEAEKDFHRADKRKVEDPNCTLKKSIKDLQGSC